MHKHHKHILIFSVLIIFALIIMIGAYSNMKSQTSYFNDSIYPFIFIGCLILIIIFLFFIIKEYFILEQKIDDMAVKSKVFDMMKDVKE